MSINKSVRLEFRRKLCRAWEGPCFNDMYIGVGRFRILGGGGGGGGGGQGLEFFGGRPGGPNSQQAHDIVTMSIRRNDVASTSFRCRVPTRF